MHPYGSLGLICIFRQDLVEIRDIHIIISATSEIISFHQTQPVYHHINST